MKFKINEKQDDKLDWQSNYFPEKTAKPKNEEVKSGSTFYGRKNWIDPQQAFDICIKELEDFFKEKLNSSMFFKVFWEARLAIVEKIKHLSTQDSKEHYLTKAELSMLTGDDNHVSNGILGRYDQFFPAGFKNNLILIQGNTSYGNIGYSENDEFLKIKRQNNCRLGFLASIPEESYNKTKVGDLTKSPFRDTDGDTENSTLKRLLDEVEDHIPPAP